MGKIGIAFVSLNDMFDGITTIIVFGTFLLAGTVKGVIGLGLPTVSLALLTVAIDLPTAMGLLIVPSFITNLRQALTGGSGVILAKRIWPFLLMATVWVGWGSLALTRVETSLLSLLLGTLLVTYSLVNLAGIRIALNPKQEIWASPLLGAINGILTGMTGSFVVPGVMFLQAIGLSRDQLIQSMGMLFTLSTVALGVTLYGHHLLDQRLGIVSGVAVLPALVGMAFGQWIRKKLSETLFRQMFFIALLALGLYIILGAD